MNIQDLELKFQNDKLFQAQFAASLAKNIQLNSIPDENSEFVIEQDENEKITGLNVGKESDSAKYKILIADAAINTLKDAGVTDFSGLKGINNGVGTKAWNVVYKGGGWIVNGKKGPEINSDKIKGLGV